MGNWGGANILASVPLPYGMGGVYTSQYVPAVYAVSVAWDAEDSARVYLGQRYIGALSSTPAPSVINAFDIRTPFCGNSWYILNLFTRLSYRATTPGAELMLPDDGLDPYYP
jgi:hypothetical protein